MTERSPQYDPHAYETIIYKKWEDANVFSPSKNASGKPYVIMMPLPNVTGSLHMGHALNGTMQDILTRYHRMLGKAALWQPGTDHAGIATQTMVEKELKKEGKTRHDLGREKFLERVWAWKEKYGHTIIEQQKRLGLSCDWSRAAFTMDPTYVRAVQEVFVRYYQKGYIYRGNRIVNWCPDCASVVSDLEVKHEERKTQLITLRYPLADTSGHIDVATTRPETMLGDTAVAVHPADARYQGFIGKKVKLPLTGREVPIIADERIDQSFGTGAVKVTPAHDPLDADLAVDHKLPTINVIGQDGRLTANAGDFKDLLVKEGRTKVLQALRDAGIVQSEIEYTHNVALCDRSNTIIEPLISRQWFVDMSKLKEGTIKVAQEEQVKFHPPRWKKHFLTWMENVHDWTISRQLWWGQPIPVWWKPSTRDTEQEESNFVVSIERPEGEWQADPDVLDTWFSSAIWPLATLGWPEATEDLKKFYPTSTLVTARDILYLWVARMIFTGLELRQDIPFRDVVIHPTVLNKKGQRMSKSLGTGVDPLELIEKYSADATRFGLMYQMSYDNQAIKFDEDAIKSARNFANKIWNLNRLLESLPSREEESLADQWIKSRLNQTTQEVTDLLNQFKLGEAARALYNFVWTDFADWYVEILKVEGSVTHAQAVFQKLLALLHPFMPHITEVLWKGDQMLIISPWPTLQAKSHRAADKTLARFQDLVSTLRSTRVLLGIPPGEVLTVAISKPPLPGALTALAKVKLVQQVKTMRAFPTPAGETVFVSADSVTPDRLSAARARLEQQAAALKDQIAHQQKVLTNMQSKASDERVAKQQEMLTQAEKQLAEVTHSLKLLAD